MKEQTREEASETIWSTVTPDIDGYSRLIRNLLEIAPIGKLRRLAQDMEGVRPQAPARPLGYRRKA